MTAREFKKLLAPYDDQEVQFTDGNMFKSSICGLKEMFYAPMKGGSRGEPDDNISFDKDEEFYQKVIVVQLDW